MVRMKPVCRCSVCSLLSCRCSEHRSKNEKRPRRVRSCYWSLKWWEVLVDWLGRLLAFAAFSSSALRSAFRSESVPELPQSSTKSFPFKSRLRINKYEAPTLRGKRALLFSLLTVNSRGAFPRSTFDTLIRYSIAVTPTGSDGSSVNTFSRMVFATTTASASDTSCSRVGARPSVQSASAAHGAAAAIPRTMRKRDGIDGIAL